MFLEGCGLPDAWAGRARFTVGELGFGTGLNIVALLDLWRRTRAPGARLNLFSIEAFPLDVRDAARALGRWPELGEVATPLLARWPGRAAGFHRVDLPEFGAVLDLAVLDAADALKIWSGSADAWFLDGFSPALNADMWSPQVLELVAARSAPGARAATFTLAGAVRRGLDAAGFRLERKSGFGRKRERLEAGMAGTAPPEGRSPRVAVIGAGVAGASLVRAFRAERVEAALFDPRGPGGGASGNPSALVTPRLDAGLGPAARLFAQGFARAVDIYERETPEAIIARGAVQLRAKDNDARRFETIAGSDLFEPEVMAVLGPSEAAAALGELADGGLRLTTALVVEPAAVLAAFALQTVTVVVAGLRAEADGWSLLGEDGAVAGRADVVVVAAGPGLAALTGLPVSPVRGQVSWTDQAQTPVAVAFGGYAIPTRSGVLFGATHDQGDADEAARPEDDRRNLALVAKGAPRLAERLEGAALSSRAALRAATPDRLPLAGAVAGMPGVFVLGGLGARGFCMAPLLAEHVVALALGRPSPLPADLAVRVAPDRFTDQGRKA